MAVFVAVRLVGLDVFEADAFFALAGRFDGEVGAEALLDLACDFPAVAALDPERAAPGFAFACFFGVFFDVACFLAIRNKRSPDRAPVRDWRTFEPPNRTIRGEGRRSRSGNTSRMSLHVIVTAFNPDSALLERAVASALVCDSVERVTIVDDGSAAPVKCPVSDKRVEVVHRQNGGPSAARNTGLDRVRCDYAMMLDDDDELIAEGVAEVVSLATRLGAVGALVGRIEERDDGSVYSRLAPAEWAGKTMPCPGDAFRPIQIFNASGTLISRRAIDLGLRYDETLWVVEDREFIRRLADIGPIAISAGAAVRSGVRPGGVRLTSAANLVKRARGHQAMMSKWLDGESEPHFRVATLWLLNAMSRAGLSRDETFMALHAVARERGWIGPLRRLKFRSRAFFRRPSA